MITFALVGVAIAVWFGRTAGRLGHGFWRASVWSVAGFGVFVLPMAVVPNLVALGYAVVIGRQRFSALPASVLAGMVAASWVVGFLLAWLVHSRILLRTGTSIPSIKT